MCKNNANSRLLSRVLNVVANLMTVGIPFDHEIFRKIAYKACFKCRATAVSNSNEFDPEVTRQWKGIGFKR